MKKAWSLGRAFSRTEAAEMRLFKTPDAKQKFCRKESLKVFWNLGFGEGWLSWMEMNPSSWSLPRIVLFSEKRSY